jgi:hypothetical protein
MGHVATLEPFTVGRRGLPHVETPELSYTGRRVRSRGTRGNIGALLYRSVGLTARGNVRSLPHQERVGSRGTRGDTGALFSHVACPVPQGMWRSQRSPTPGAGLKPQGHASTLEPFPVRCGVDAVGLDLNLTQVGT